MHQQGSGYVLDMNLIKCSTSHLYRGNDSAGVCVCVCDYIKKNSGAWCFIKQSHF